MKGRTNRLDTTWEKRDKGKIYILLRTQGATGGAVRAPFIEKERAWGKTTTCADFSANGGSLLRAIDIRSPQTIAED